MSSFAAAMMFAELQRIAGLSMGMGIGRRDSEKPEAARNIAKVESTAMYELAPHLPRQIGGLADVQLILRTSSSLSGGARDALYGLWEKNVGHLAEGTDLEMDEEDKREELFDSKTRFFIVLKRPVPLQPTSGNDNSANTADAGINGEDSKPKKKKKKGPAKLGFGPHELVGYCSFRFDLVESYDDEELLQAITCNELQLQPRARGKGLGKLLMAELERIGKSRGMDKIELTCLSKNKQALGFFKSIGYTRDDLDHARHRHNRDIDHYILNKSFRTQKIEVVDD